MADVTQYIGARYVPILGRIGEDSIEWDNSKEYEPLTIVSHDGNSYTSRQYVPIGIDISNNAFWAQTGNYNAQVEQYRRETGALQTSVSALINDVSDLTNATNANTSEVSKLQTSVSALINDVSDLTNATNANTSEVSKIKGTAQRVFETVADMKVSTVLEDNMIVQTLGFRTVGDNGGCYYEITSDDVVADDITVIALENNLHACYIQTEQYVMPEMFGAYGDGTHDDVLAVDACFKTFNIVIGDKSKTYAIGNNVVPRPSAIPQSYDQNYHWFLYLYKNNTKIINLNLIDINPSESNNYFSVFGNATGDIDAINGLYIDGCSFIFEGNIKTASVYNRRCIMRLAKSENIVVKNSYFKHSGFCALVFWNSANTVISENQFVVDDIIIDNNNISVEPRKNVYVVNNYSYGNYYHIFKSEPANPVDAINHVNFCGIEILGHTGGTCHCAGNTIINAHDGINVTAGRSSDACDCVLIYDNIFHNCLQDIGLWASVTDASIQKTLSNVFIYNNNSYKDAATINFGSTFTEFTGFVISRGEYVAGVRNYDTLDNIKIYNNYVYYEETEDVTAYNVGPIQLTFDKATNILVANNTFDNCIPSFIRAISPYPNGHLEICIKNNIFNICGSKTGTIRECISCRSNLDSESIRIIDGNLFNLQKGGVLSVSTPNTITLAASGTPADSYIGRNNFINMFPYEMYKYADTSGTPITIPFTLHNTPTSLRMAINLGGSTGDTCQVSSNKLVTGPINCYADPNNNNVRFIPVSNNSLGGILLVGGGTISTDVTCDSVESTFRSVTIS